MSRLIATAVLAAVVFASLVAVALFVIESRDVPMRDDVEAAATAIPDDAFVLIAPPWSFAPLQALKARAQHTAPADGPWDTLHRHRHRKIALWREPDAAPWLTGRVHPTLSAPVQRFGVVEVAVVDDVPATFDALSAPSQVRGGRVVREWAQVTENSHEVLHVTPRAGTPVEIVFDEVDLSGSLVIAASHTRPALDRLRAAQRRNSAVSGVVVVEAFVDDERVYRNEMAPGFVVEPHRAGHVARFVHERVAGEGFVADTVAVPAGRHRLRFVVTAAVDALSVGIDAFSPGKTERPAQTFTP